MIDEKKLLDFLTDDKKELTPEEQAIEIITAGSYNSIVDAVHEKRKNETINQIIKDVKK